MNPLEAFNQGDLAMAIKVATDHVRSHADDAAARLVLAELLVCDNAFERADRQLETAGDLDPGLSVNVVTLRRLVHAEVARHDFHDSGRPPEFFAEPTPAIRARLKAAVLLRSGDLAGAMEALDEANTLHTPEPGMCDDTPFDDLLDADDVLGPVFEVLTADGRYFWIPAAQIASMSFEAPTRPIDLLYRPGRITFRDGTTGPVFVPTVYAATKATSDVNLKLGRATDWVGAEGEPIRGIGQRVFLVGEEGRALLDMKEITFARGAQA